MFNRFKNLFKEQGGDTGIRKQQYIRIAAVLFGVGCIAFLILTNTKTKDPDAPTQPGNPSKVSLASSSVDVRDIWADRIQNTADKAQKTVEEVKAENQLLQKRLESMEEILKHAVSGNELGSKGDTSGSLALSPQHSLQIPSPLPGPESTSEPLPEKPKILHLSLEEGPVLQNVDHYMPAGTYSKAVLTSGVVVSTAVATQSNPQPIVLRLADAGNMPRGFKSKVKDAVLIGGCYGDLSSERAICRITTLSYIESDGTTIEKAVEGWLIGEDGSPGLRGKVVDRSGEVAREAFLSGILSGMSNFLQFESQRSVFPVSPFGQSNALGAKEALQSGLGKGTSNALDKLAEFSIKRAESMQPVIVVNPGRIVDVVFKRGVDLNPSASTGLHLIPAASHISEGN